MTFQIFLGKDVLTVEIDFEDTSAGGDQEGFSDVH
jgi:hypothetical protein